MTHLNAAALDAIEQRADAATEGPWHPATTGVERGDHWSVIDYPTMNNVCHIPSQDGENEAQRRPDAKFIAYARTDIPALLAAVREAQQRAEQAEQAVARVREWVKDDGNALVFKVSIRRALDGGQEEET